MLILVIRTIHSPLMDRDVFNLVIEWLGATVGVFLEASP